VHLVVKIVVTEFVCRLARITVEELWNLEWAPLASGRGGFFGRLFGR
jgi:hypothetical protein